jgi:hypothetical protein
MGYIEGGNRREIQITFSQNNIEQHPFFFPLSVNIFFLKYLNIILKLWGKTLVGINAKSVIFWSKKSSRFGPTFGTNTAKMIFLLGKKKSFIIIIIYIN